MCLNNDNKKKKRQELKKTRYLKPLLIIINNQIIRKKLNKIFYNNGLTCVCRAAFIFLCSFGPITQKMYGFLKS